ncbi:hypothetical protein ACQKNX_08085 [Lysinibacillus sp. NPDC093712]|uniref:hypothetical protein n=1 Tax=Lysinibacillus sp. NPDC093712 TaxID=3390579 RepID=UPI003D034C61
MTTLTITNKFDLIIDLFAEASTSVNFVKSYRDMSPEERVQVDNEFMNQLIKHKVKINASELEAFISEYPNSYIIPILSDYTTNNHFARLSEIDITANTINERKGQKVTILKFNDFGFPIVIHTTITSAENKPYAQYSESLNIIHKPKRKRTNYRNIIIGSEQISIYDGWIDIDNKASHTISTDKDVTVTQSMYGCFDPSFITDATATTNKEPFASLNIKEA